MNYAYAVFAVALLMQTAAAVAQTRHHAPQVAGERFGFEQFRAMDRSQWGLEPGLQPDSSGCVPGSGSAVWGRGNALLGYSCSDSANGS